MKRRIAIITLVGLGVALMVIGMISRSLKIRPGKSEAKALFQKAVSLEAHGEADEATKLYQELVSRFAQDELAASAWYKLGTHYASKGLWQKAKEAYRKIITDFSNFKQISEVEKGLWEANIKLLFSPVMTEGDMSYKVEPQDTLSKIAAKYNTTVELLMRSNNLKNDLIRPGERLKISTAKYSVIIDKSQGLLTLKANEEIFKVYSVATGKDNCTPVGTFKIVEKLEHPDWYKRGEGIVPADSPENILGTRWLGLSEAQYGIHGGAAPQDLGQQFTNGCVRMLNPDAEEIFAILPRGTEVTIVD